LDDKVQIEKDPKEVTSLREEIRHEDKSPEISPERIERMKKAFRPTWLQDQINSIGNGKGTNGKKE
jgi:hypothetical protein